MNEEQKEQNIPAAVPSENNQNIAPVKKWQLKSWQIARVSTILLLISLLISITYLMLTGSELSMSLVYMFLGFSIPFLFSFTVAVASSLLLKSDMPRQRFIGAILSIFLGAILLFMGLLMLYFVISDRLSFLNIGLDVGMAVIGIAGILLFLAGIHYFWKKV